MNPEKERILREEYPEAYARISSHKTQTKSKKTNAAFLPIRNSPTARQDYEAFDDCTGPTYRDSAPRRNRRARRSRYCREYRKLFARNQKE